MRYLKDRHEIAMSINSHKTPVVRIDLADADEYGLVSGKVLIDNGTFRDGFPYYVHTKICAYVDERKFSFHSHGTVLTDSFSFRDMEELLGYANAPIVKKDSDVILAIVDSRDKTVYKPIVLHTSNRVDPYCMTPLTFADTDNDATPYLLAAGCDLTRWTKGE